MGNEMLLLLFMGLVTFLRHSNGCQMDGVSDWRLPVTEQIFDIDRGVIFNRSTANIAEMEGGINSGEGVNAGMYLSIDFVDSQFTITTTSAYEMYEEYETSSSISFSVVFRCDGGQTETLVFVVFIADTNNNPPRFLPSDEYEFTITPPLPPGFQITGCGDDNNIIVRDIDLTTQRIDFELEENPYFEIAYNGRSTTDPKEFLALLKTKDLIRTLPEVVELTVSATDVDQTGDPPITTTAKIRIQANDDFQFPDEPIFSQPFYLATYTETHQLVIQGTISLQQGFDDAVTFSLEGDFSDNFYLTHNGNQIAISVESPLSAEIFLSGQIVLVIRAEREHTSGATVAVIVQLPEVPALEFEHIQYKGEIVDNVLQAIQLSLKQGYESGFNVTLLNEHASYFSADVQGNVVTLSMAALDANTINVNNFITLQVVASNQYSSATAIVTLDIIKDDNVTPMFEKAVYNGDYDPATGLTLERIALEQGYDETVSFSLQGEHASYFQMSNNGAEVLVTTPGISATLWPEQQLLLTVAATKPRSVPATAAISIRLPAVPVLEFEQMQYEGQIIDNVLQAIQLSLTQGYENGFNVTLVNEHASSFTANIQGNVLTLSMAALDTNTINANNFITLQVVASNQFSSATAIVTLDIIKDDNVTPVFENALYNGDYDPVTGLTLERIALAQGYDDTVSFSLQGEHASYFQMDNIGAEILVTSSGIPATLWPEQQLLLTVVATKSRLVPATAAISIRLPAARQLAFESSTYVGTLQDATLALQPIILSTGFADDVVFTLSSDYENFFTFTTTQNQVTITLLQPLPESVILDNSFITLTLSASGVHTVPSTTFVVLEILKQDVTTPVFTENIYRATYVGPGDIDVGEISLAQGFDSTVTFSLQGEQAEYFNITNDGNALYLQLQTEIPLEVIFREKVFLFNVLADKPLTVGANAAVAINFPQELTEATELSFSQNTYVGYIEDNTLTLGTIVLETGFENGTTFTLTGEYASHFTLQMTENAISLSIVNSLPEELIENSSLIILELEASRERAVSTSASIVIEIIKEAIVPPVFNEAFYRGVYANNELHFDDVISLSQGYDESVTFELTGAYAIWFSISYEGNSVNLSRNAVDIPEEVLENYNQLLFTIEAKKPNAITATSVISIDLPKEIPEPVIMRFTNTSYVGSISNGVLYAPAILLLGDRDPVELKLTGEFASHFEVSHSSNNVQLRLINEIPEEELQELTFIILDIQASYPEAINGYTTVVLEIIKQPQIVTPIFEHAYYIGEYSEQGGLQLDQSIQLIQGFDESVLFTLSGDDSQWFDLVDDGQNNVTLILKDTGLGQIRDRSHLVFSVLANKPESVPGRVAVIINLADLTTTVPLGFSQNFYRGSIDNNNLTIASINLVTGYSPDMNVTFTGDYMDYFQLTNQEGLFTLHLISELPVDLVEANNILVFTLEVQIDDTKAHTTVILELVKIQPVLLAFEEVYYLGSYSITGGFTFDPQITLTEHDETVSFSLEGQHSQWFSIIENPNSVSLIQELPIPAEVLSNNQHLVFVIVGERENDFPARSTIIVSIVDDTTVLTFERNVYLGSIQNDEANMESIVLSNGFSDAVEYSLLGELQSYFELSQQNNTIFVILETTIPKELIPENNVISLELLATAPQATSAVATLVFTVIEEKIEPLVFAEAYYIGTYSETEGLDFPVPVTLLQGYNENINFSLEGDSSQYFEPVVTNNTVTVRLVTPIPQAVLMNSNKLIFVIRASRDDEMTARAAIVISLIHDIVEDAVLGFDRIAYVGVIKNDTLSLDPITLSEGYSEEVSFTLHGSLSNYFNVTNEEELVTIVLLESIPIELLPPNGILIFELVATKPEALSAYATIVLQIIEEELSQPVFSQSYYTGSYTQADGLTFGEVISLIDGYDEHIQFSLEGDNAQYFELIISGNSVILQETSKIPQTVSLVNHHLILTIRADRPEVAQSVRVPIVIALLDVNLDDLILRFQQVAYLGSLENDAIILEQIALIEGFSSSVSFTLVGELSVYFNVTNEDENIFIALQSSIPQDLIPENNIILLELQASAPQMVPAYTTIVLNVVKELTILKFEQTAYIGTIENGASNLKPIVLSQGFSEKVSFTLLGELSGYFNLETNETTAVISIQNQIPEESLPDNGLILLKLQASAPEATSTHTIIIFKILEEDIESLEPLTFSKNYYTGLYSEVDGLTFEETITLATGYNENVMFSLEGDSAQYFELVISGNAATLRLSTPIPPAVILNNQQLIFVISAIRTGSMTARAPIIISLFDVIPDNESAITILGFDRITYVGTIENNIADISTILLSEGYTSNVTFNIFGDLANYFFVSNEGAEVTIALDDPIPDEFIPENRVILIELQAVAPSSLSAHAAIVFVVIEEPISEIDTLSFSQTYYTGHYDENEGLTFENVISLAEGFNEDVQFSLEGDGSEYFEMVVSENAVTLKLATSIPPEVIINNHQLIFTIRANRMNAVSSRALVIISLINYEIHMEFNKPFYTGEYTEDNELVFEDIIYLTQGFHDSVLFSLEGDQSEWFQLTVSGNAVSIILDRAVPQEVIENNRKLILIIVAQKNDSTIRAAIIISITGERDCQPNDGVQFDKIFFEGIVEGGVVQHETISLSGYTGTDIEILGEYAELFAASHENGLVTVQGVGSVALATDILYVPLELRAGSAGAVLLLDVLHSDEPSQPLVEFSSTSYMVRVIASQIGVIGRVQATADTGEAVTYSLVIENEHLQQRVSINENGELILSAPVFTGVYTFNAVATTIFTRVSATAQVHLTAEAITECGEDSFVLAPLMVLERDEESAHQNIVVLNTEQFPGCRYQLNNRWPIDQSWLYIDDDGLHTTAIDREHESIAYMALSQVQVELILECDTDEATRAKRSVSTDARLDHLGPYDYGDNKWILTDSIQYNPRRSLVNLIVNDINDNAPIFNGKENEPVVVGYPISDLEERILPRALAEVEATDADVGENAALVYWSSSELLAVSPLTGSVHVRNNDQLENNTIVTIHATDLNGQGLTGTLDLLVVLLDTNHIAVVTVREAFLEDERNVLANISSSVGYEVKALKSAVISDEDSLQTETRNKREAVLSPGASLQLYVYGLIEQEPVPVQRLTEDISSGAITAVNIASSVSLEDHLESLEICALAGHDTGLLVATIVLSVLLFILIVVAAVWFFLRWRKRPNYEEFSDANSIESTSNSTSTRPKPVEVKNQPIAVSKSRINVEDLKRSERRLQEMLEAPVEEITVQPSVAPKKVEAKLNIPEPPIVIQSIDRLKDVDDSEDEDEYGERAKGKRKSVVTFNENVEKIIHVEDTPDEAEYEVYKL